MSDFALMELFREEVETHAGVLTSGLIALESGPLDPQRIEPLMRAAHSLKGAARVMGLDAVVGIAHAMEDGLIAAGEGKFELTPIRVDALLRGVDWIVALAAVSEDDLPGWLVGQADASEELERRLRDLSTLESEIPPSGSGVPVASGLEARPAPSAPHDESASVKDAQSSRAGGATDNDIGAPQHTTRPNSAAAADAAGNADRAVKVNADVVNRFINLASESLVEAHRLEDIMTSFQRIRQRMARLTAILQGSERLGGEESASALAGNVSRAGAMLEEVRTDLALSLEDLDVHARRTATIAESQFKEVVASRMRPFDEGARSFPRQVRDLAREQGKQVNLEITGRMTQVDRDILAKLEAPLGHLLRNAVDHGMETPDERRAAGKPEAGSIRLEARHHGGSLLISVSDDGRGVDRERLRRKIVERNLTTAELATRMNDGELFDFLFLPGLSTRDVTSQVSGRGVGLDVVQTMIHAEGGAVSVESDSGAGTVFRLLLPVTRSVVRGLITEVQDELYAFPLARIGRLVELTAGDLATVEGRTYFVLDDANVALISCHELLGLEPPQPSTGATIRGVVLVDHGESYAIEVESFVGERELVVRPLDPRLGKVPHVAAVSIGKKGRPILVMDVDDLLRSVASLLSGGSHIGRRGHTPATSRQRVRRILVVEDSITVRELERRLLEHHGYEVDVAVDGMEGWNALILGNYDLVVSDVDMPRMNGIELVRRIRADARFERLPVMIVSYKDREEDRMAGMEAGADYYLAKSGFRDDALIHAVQDLIGEAAV